VGVHRSQGSLEAMPELWVTHLGPVRYAEAFELQRTLRDRRAAGELPDLLLVLEHPPVYTRGKRTEPGDLPMGAGWYAERGIEVEDTDRGGRVTYHGPAQLVGYPIMSLRPYRDDVHDYIRRMERVMIESLGAFGVECAVIEGLTGVWAGELEGVGADATADSVAADVAGGSLRKIGSIGVHVNRGVTTHGFAINVNNDLQPFEWIVPCGIEGCRATSLCRELGATQDPGAFMDTVAERFGDVYERAPVATEAAALAERVEGLDALVSAGPAAAHLGRNGSPAPVR
jgi:lipoyl(octanoyl) transferase